MPGEDYYTNFRKGDPCVKVDQGFARLPGAGYAALHPELEDVNPEDYPGIHKMAILADVAPYSREYNTTKILARARTKDRWIFNSRSCWAGPPREGRSYLAL